MTLDTYERKYSCGCIWVETTYDCNSHMCYGVCARCRDRRPTSEFKQLCSSHHSLYLHKTPYNPY